MMPEQTDLTQSQVLFWTGQILVPDGPHYNMALAFELAGPIDEILFQKAFQALIDRSDALRLCFKTVADRPVQIFREALPYEVQVLDFTVERDPEQALRNWAQERSAQVFPIESILFDSVLIRMPEDRLIWYFNQHHLITDAWSTALLYDTMADLYQRAVAGNLDDAPILPGYAAYVDFEKQNSSAGGNEKSRKYWSEQANKLPAYVDLYGDYRTTRSSRSERVSLDLGLARSQKLRELALEPDLRSWNINLSLYNIFATLLSAFLHRVSGNERLAFGTPAHNRSRNDFKSTPGVFIEVFPLIIQIEDSETFSSLFQKVREEVHQFLRHAQPGMVTPEITRGYNVILNYIHASFSDFGGRALGSEWIHSGHSDPNHQLRLQVHDFDATGSIQLHFDLSEEIFSPGMRKEVPGHFAHLLDAFIKDRQQEISRPSLLSSEEFEAMVARSRNTQEHAQTRKTILQSFRESVMASPQATALTFAGQSISYAELDANTDSLAGFLRARGVQPSDRVAIYLRRSPFFITAVYACLRLGATYIPIATDYPQQRIATMLSDAEPVLVLTESGLMARLNQDVDALALDQGWDTTEEAHFTESDSDAQPEALAYIMYTSGSTGKPKGVMISHGALENYINWAHSQYSGSERISMPFFTSTGFDLTVTSLFLPLISGGILHIYQEPESGPDLSIMRVLQENAGNIIKLTPSHLALISPAQLKASWLRTFIVGGEDFKTPLADKLYRALGDQAFIYNEYGPTEATVGCVLHTYSIEESDKTSVPIGKPIAGMQALVLDQFQHPVLGTLAGELCIAGPGLASGYWKNEMLTTEKFVDHPFEPGALIYKTGDLVRYNDRGDLEFLGRADQQVKVGGRRIELAEIESALQAFDGISDCAVIAIEHNQTPSESIQYCSKCGLPSSYPNAEYDAQGVCNLCRSFSTYQQKVEPYFKAMDDLKTVFSSKPGKSHYDCLALLSGGKDSTYMVAQLAEMGLRVLAFTLDNGYISEEAKSNIRRVVSALGVDHIFGKTPAMNMIFVDSLHRHSNVCNGCFKTIYTLSTAIALEKEIPFIVTGLSRGQFFETRLTEELFWNAEVDLKGIDQIILDARKAYHQVEDAVSQFLDVSMFADEAVFDKVRFIDFYRYCDVSLDDMLAYLDKRLPWVRPTDTGRSTNCLINQVGIYVHKKQQGYNNYAFPYSWDVRIGHKTRDEALDEINEEINEREVHRIMREIGYEEEAVAPRQQIVAYYAGGEKHAVKALVEHLQKILPDFMIPSLFQQVEALPLSTNGKVDRLELVNRARTLSHTQTEYVAPSNELEELLAGFWQEVMRIPSIGVHDDFIALGGTSLAAIRIMARINDQLDLEIPVTTLFEHPSIHALAREIEMILEQLLNELER